MDNPLKITGEARHFSLTNRALKAIYDRKGEEPPFDIPFDKDGKVDKCIENVARLYNETSDTNGVQIIFSDIAVNSDKGNFSAYDYIKKELIESYGIPEEEIIFAPKADSKDREDIFRDINLGKYRVVIASTNTLGTGANIQQSLYALHHLDIPWKPSDFEQREGRILRQGNKYDEVEIFNYVTEGTMDSYLYQTVANKARFIAQFLNNESVGRSMEDCDEKVLAYGEFQAQAEGNPEFKRFVELSNEINEISMLRSEYAHETVLTQQKIVDIPKEIESMKLELQQIINDKNRASQIKDFVLTKSDGSIITEKKVINNHLLSLIQQKLEKPDKEIPSMKIGNFELTINKSVLNKDVQFVVSGEQTYMCFAGITDKQDNVHRLNNLFEKTIPKRKEDVKSKISFLEENLKQAEERVAAPYPREKEFYEKSLEYKELEEKLSGITSYEDEIYDPEDEPIIETAEEKAEREAVYNVDEDDYQPNVNDDMNNQPTKPKI